MNPPTSDTFPPGATREVNFDGLVGPTHSYAGLSFGNVASIAHRGRRAHPRAAALQGLAKMKALADLGIPQAVLPPHERPDLDTLRRFGFSGSAAEVLQRAAREAPRLLAAATSASAMWVANAATVTPSSDAPDGRVHFTPASLIAKLHRSIEPAQTAAILRAVFHDGRHFVHHAPVPAAEGFGDEGAANHTRLAPAAGARGLHVFVYGHSVLAPRRQRRSVRYPSRQALEASEAVARAHGLDPAQVRFVAQSPRAIDAGVFHNDVIAVGNDDVFLYHEFAYANADRTVGGLRRAFAALHGGAGLHCIRVPARRVSLRDAVRSYLFNSQLVTVAPGRMVLVAPEECREIRAVRRFVDDWIGEGATPVRSVQHVDLRESMRNGGGPACLRLRVVLSATERAALPPGVFVTGETYPRLVAWVKRHYRENLDPTDLADPALLEENHRALDELTRLLGIAPVYPFQR